MSRKDRDDSIWLSEHSDKRRIRDAENARQNRAEITKALSHGQIRRRDLVKWGLFTSAGLMLPIGGLNPFVRSAYGQTAPMSVSSLSFSARVVKHLGCTSASLFNRQISSPFACGHAASTPW